MDRIDMTASPLLATGLTSCHDERGAVVPRAGSGQDAEWAIGRPWPEPRFEVRGETVLDRLTRLVWSRDPNPLVFPLPWDEALAGVRELNTREAMGHDDWRLPNRRELRSLISYGARKPALPAGHPFGKVFLGWCWTSTTSAMAPAYAWYVHLEGGRMFYGRKDSPCLVWPVRGEGALPATGQSQCFDVSGQPVDCVGTGQDGELRQGLPWPMPRFEEPKRTSDGRQGVLDRLTGLVWLPQGTFCPQPVNWVEALAAVEWLNQGGERRWRLPNINELESLVDASRHSPALPEGHPFGDMPEACWSSTSSFFEPDWAMALYFHKGAVGVGYKPNRDFHCLAVSGPGDMRPAD